MSRAAQIAHKLVEPDKVAKRSPLALRAHSQGLSVLQLAEKEFIALPKHDGCYALVHYEKGKEFNVRSRTGEPVAALDHMVSFFDLVGAPDGVYIGEAWHPELDFPTISGTFRRQHLDVEKDLLHLVVHDFLTVEEFGAGRSGLTFVDRVMRLGPVLQIPHIYRSAPMYPVQGFGVAPWERTGHNAQSLANALVKAGGYDGLVLADPNGKWRIGPGKDGEKLKIKPNVELSLRLTYINEAIGEKTGRTVYTYLLENKEGKQFTVGSGVPHKADKLAHVGDVVEVVAMGFTEDGELREPRVKGVRNDVTEID